MQPGFINFKAKGINYYILMNNEKKVYKLYFSTKYMKKEVMNKFFVFALLGIFLTSFLISVEVVSAEEDSVSKVLDNFLGKLEVLDWTGMSAMWILSAIILIVIAYIGISFLPKIGDKKTFSFVLSVVVGILLTAMIKPEEIYALMLSYSSSSLTILSILPAVALFFAHIRAKMNHNVQAIFAISAFWIVYLLFFNAKFWYAAIYQFNWNIPLMVWIIYAAQIGLAIFSMIASGFLARKFQKDKRNEGIAAAREAGRNVHAAGESAERFNESIVNGEQ